MLLPPPIGLTAILAIMSLSTFKSADILYVLMKSNLFLFFQDKNWEVVETSRNRVDQFKRTMPLVGDLKNPAMRPRHWEKIQVSNFASGRWFPLSTWFSPSIKLTSTI